MIQPYTRLKVADNTGARELMVIRVVGGAKQNAAQLGDTIVASVKEATPRGSVKKKEVVRAIIARQTQPYQRPDGSNIRFDDNAAVIVNTDGTPKGTRIFGPVARELREKGFFQNSIVSAGGAVMNVKRGDNVLVIAGKDRGKTGKIVRVIPSAEKVAIEGVNMYKRHMRPSRSNPHGGIIDIARPVPVSNTMLICPQCNKAARIGSKLTDKGKLRICKRCGEAIGEE